MSLKQNGVKIISISLSLLRLRTFHPLSHLPHSRLVGRLLIKVQFQLLMVNS